ncbi:hypothetical protein pdam_00017462, partial [Pocillopora damicornis]
TVGEDTNTCWVEGVILLTEGGVDTIKEGGWFKFSPVGWGLLTCHEGPLKGEDGMAGDGTMASGGGEWCLIESDPGVFTELIRGFGCSGIQVEEIYSLDEASLDELRPVHGLIFLFKWKPGEEPAGPIVHESRSLGIFFAKQVITNACATQAILSVLLNCNHPDMDLGPTLSSFKEFSATFDSSLKGLSLSNSDVIRQVHNGFARQQMFEFDAKLPPKDDNVYHFVAYVPILGKLYELDGLRDGPIDLGPCTPENWLATCKPIIETRMQKYSAEEIHFNLMAIVSSRKALHLKDIDRLNQRKQHILDQVENIRRKHNYLPLIMELLKVLAKQGNLVPLVEKAKEEVQAKKAEQAK